MHQGDAASRRLLALQGQLSDGQARAAGPASLRSVPCVSEVPRAAAFDPRVMAAFIDDQMDLKKQARGQPSPAHAHPASRLVVHRTPRQTGWQGGVQEQPSLPAAQVYQEFTRRPELLPQCTEGLTKEAHRELVRAGLRAVLAAGIAPLDLFDADIKKYIYMAELAAPIDLSLVRLRCCPPHTARPVAVVACTR